FYNHTDELERMGGLWKASPWLSLCFLCQAFSLAGVPPFSGFWGKYLIVQVGLDEGHYVLVVAAILASILTLLSMMKIWLGAFWSDPASGSHLEPASLRVRAMTAVVVGMTLVSLTIGLGANRFLDLSQRAAHSLLDPQHYRAAVFAHE